MSHSIEFRWGKKSVDPKEFIARFDKKLPILVRVLEGITDSIEEHSYSRDDVYWITEIQKIRKVIFRRRLGGHISVPSNYPLLLHLIEDDIEVEAQTLGELADKLESGDTLIPATDGHLAVFGKSNNVAAKQKLGQLTYVTEYEERSLIGFLVHHARPVDTECVEIPAFMSLPLLLAEGLVNGTEQDYQMALEGIQTSCQNLTHRRGKVSGEIMMYQGGMENMKTSDYDYLKPSDYMTCKQLVRGVSYDSSDTTNSPEVFTEPPAMTTSPVYISSAPKLPPKTRKNSAPADITRERKLPAPPPAAKLGRSVSIPTALEPGDIDDQYDLYEKAEPLDDTPRAKPNNLKKSLSLSVENLWSYFKHKDKKSTEVSPPKHKAQKGKNRKKKKDPHYKKELPPLPDSCDEEGEEGDAYEETEFQPRDKSATLTRLNVPRPRQTPTLTHSLYEDTTRATNNINRPLPPSPSSDSSVTMPSVRQMLQNIEKDNAKPKAKTSISVETSAKSIKALKGRYEADDGAYIQMSRTKDLSIVEVAHRLKALNLGHYVEAFKREKMDGTKIQNCSPQMLMQRFKMTHFEATTLLESFSTSF